MTETSENNHDSEQTNHSSSPPLEKLSLKAQLLKAKSLLSDNDDNDNFSTNQHTTNTTIEGNNVVDNKPLQAIKILLNLQHEIQYAAIFSKNESLDDISTSSLLLLSTEYHLAKAYLALPLSTITTNSASSTAQPSSMARLRNIRNAIDSFYLFLNKCFYDAEGLLYDSMIRDFNKYILVWQEEKLHYDTSANRSDGDEEDDSQNMKMMMKSSFSSTFSSRDAKIQRFKERNTLEKKLQYLNQQLQQHCDNQKKKTTNVNTHNKHQQKDNHYNNNDDEEEDDDDDLFLQDDEESINRSIIISQLNLFAVDSMEELYTCLQEIEMLNVAVSMEKQHLHQQRYLGNHPSVDARSQQNDCNNDLKNKTKTSSQWIGSNHLNSKPLSVTHITSDPITGQLHIQKEEIKSKIFRPGWNQPTMTLEDFAQREVADAMARSEAQKALEESEEYQTRARKYEDLVRDGLEDNTKLVDESAKLDRDWDEWKYDNPRGSGNKMADRGDRNF